ncbi:hypothetical protein DNTS_023940 [Danionella cerebrum]|uniref:RING-type domain-containing protein n=1 Tax=Danionella cerebrum TaxID=2873325 RepID=A0A553MV30_9TELE|nr:hypothetical protein DNTS_023940 [Danionella translucida]
MAEAGIVDQDQYSCSVCLDLLKDPVTIPCGHSYCLSCIEECWNEEQGKDYKCPQCRQTFISRPQLNRNIVLSEIMENMKSINSSHVVLAEPGDIACDFCAVEIIKAVKSCLECRASYCEVHVQPHYNVPALRKHSLVKASKIPTCSKHDKLLEVYCRTDQTCVCMHCLMDDHKGHDTIKVTDTQTKVKKTIQAKEKELQIVTTDITCHSESAVEAIKSSKKAFAELVKLIEKKSIKMIELLKAQEKADLDEGEKIQDKLKEDISELKKRDDALENLLQTDDNVQFLQKYESVSCSSGLEDFPRLSFQPRCSFEDVNKLICELTKSLENACLQEIDKTLNKVSDLPTKTPKFGIKVGDNVRVKPSVDTPTHKWGSVTHQSIGVVKKILDELMTVDFPEQKNWTGLVSEMESVVDVSSGSSSQDPEIKVGDKVRVKPTVVIPTHKWGAVSHKSIGVVQKIKPDESLIVDFPEHTNWKGILSEMESVTNEISILDSTFKVGDKVRVKLSVDTPKHKWGAVSHKSIGVVQNLSSRKIPVNIKVGDKVRVKDSVITPKFTWGGYVSHTSVGVVKGKIWVLSYDKYIKSENVMVDFPKHKGWKGILSEMEVIID